MRGRNVTGVQTCALPILGVSIPNFWLALLLVMLFALKLGWLPPGGIEGWESYVLPCMSMCVGGIAMQARQSRSSILEVIRADYVDRKSTRLNSSHVSISY